ncbi:TIGR03618 family F420-dependent PPOX class oxidoreductase, partial [Nocardia cyriacigeorgica]|uniref:TIGR03618 family F420-dependent PPOX class oxidoreductase n=1 Tax=Nocardia cyriacigeorgica TaxID=135487 RepID=UPI002457E539
MATLSDPKVRDFLTEGTRTAKVAFTAGDGRPVVVPVWFIVEGEELVFNTGKTSAKGKALVRDNRIALCVDLEQRPYAFVQVQGTVTLSEDLDELNTHLDSVTADGAHTLITTASGKFYSNGLDLDWLSANGERADWYV